MEPEQVVEQNPMTVFELCRELHLKGFPQKRLDESWYFVNPNMLVRLDNFDCLKLEDKRTTVNVSDNIYYPTESDFLEYLGTDLQQLVQTVRSGYFAYANSTIGEGITTRSGGNTPWLALANVVYARLCERDIKFPTADVSDSENVQEGSEPNV